MSTKAELEKQLAEEKARNERQRAYIKRQNEAAKTRWDTVSCRLPKGAKDRAKALNLSLNGLINKLVLAELDRLETAATDQQQDTPPAPPEPPEPTAVKSNGKV